MAFQGDVQIGGSGLSSLEADVELDGMTLNSAGPLQFGADSTDTLDFAGGSVNIVTTNEDVTFMGPIDGTVDFSVDSGSGDLVLQSTIGNSNALSSFTSSGGNLAFQGKQTVTGDVSHTAQGGINITADIDPSNITLTSGGNLSYSSALLADDTILLLAGGDLTQAPGGDLRVTNPGSTVMGSFGRDAAMDGDITAVSEVRFTATAAGKFEHENGKIRANRVTLNAGDLIRAIVSTNFLTAVTPTGNITILSCDGLATTIENIQTNDGSILFNFIDGATHTFLDVATTSGGVTITGDGGIVTNPDLSAGQTTTTNGDGSIDISTTNGGDIYIGLFEAVGQPVTVTASGSIQDTQDDNQLDIVQNSPSTLPGQAPITLTAGVNIGGAALQGNTVDPLGRVEIFSDNVTINKGSGVVEIDNAADSEDSGENGALFDPVLAKESPEGTIRHPEWDRGFIENLQPRYLRLLQVLELGNVSQINSLFASLSLAFKDDLKKSFMVMCSGTMDDPQKRPVDCLLALEEEGNLPLSQQLILAMLRAGSSTSAPAFQQVLQEIRPPEISRGDYDAIIEQLGGQA